MPTEYEGARARIIELYGSPFGDAKVSQLVSEIRAVIQEHYGQPGCAFSRNFVDRPRRLPFAAKLRQRYLTYQRELAALGESNVSDRIALYFACIWLAGEWVEKLLELGGSPEKVVRKLYLESCEIGKTGDTGLRTLELILSWIESNRNSFDSDADKTQVR